MSTTLFAVLVCVSALSSSWVSGYSFVPLTRSSTRKFMSISMGGGRSLAEKGLSQKTMFKQMRQKFNEASQIPGFFDVGDGPTEIDLYCKSNTDGSQVGDCPFAQFVQLVLLKKGLRYSVKPTKSSEKPDWLLEKYEGKMPCLVHKEEKIIDSLAIAEYIEKTFPHSSLTRQGAFSYQEVMEKIGGFFPALAACIKNTDSSNDAKLVAEVEAQLDIIDEILRSTPGRYLCGIEETLADLYLLPQLFHGVVTLDHFKGVEFYHMEGAPTRPALEAYVGRMLDMEEFNDSRVYYSADQVIYGWKVARGEA